MYTVDSATGQSVAQTGACGSQTFKSISYGTTHTWGIAHDPPHGIVKCDSSGTLTTETGSAELVVVGSDGSVFGITPYTSKINGN